MKSFFPLLFVLFISFTVFSQEKKDTLSLPEQFDHIYRTSSSYQEYKVIRKTRYQKLKQDVVDSIQSLQNELDSKNSLIKSKNDSIQEIKKVSATLSNDLNLTIAEKNSTSLLGILVSKTTYNIILWSLIIILLISLLYFLYQFKNSHSITSEAKSNLAEAEEELAEYKKKSLEREQKLRRQLQDEINKQRGV